MSPEERKKKRAEAERKRRARDKKEWDRIKAALRKPDIDEDDAELQNPNMFNCIYCG